MKNRFILFIIEAILTLLMFFSESYFIYITGALLLIIDLIILADVLSRKWKYEEVLEFASLFCVAVFAILYMIGPDTLLMVFGMAIVLLFVILAIIDYASSEYHVHEKKERLERPIPPKQDTLASGEFDTSPYSDYYTDAYKEHAAQKIQIATNITQTTKAKQVQDHKSVSKAKEPAYYYDIEEEPAVKVQKPRDVYVQERSSQKISKGITAKAIEYELEKEASELKRAQRAITNLETYNTESELIKEARELKSAQKVLSKELKKQDLKELSKEAKDILNVQKQISAVNNMKKRFNEAKLKKQSKALENAEKQIKELEFLGTQEKIISKAKEVARKEAKKAANAAAKKTVASAKAQEKNLVVQKTQVKTIRAKQEELYFATDNGNKFHEPGCLAIKKVQKSKLTLYTSKKDAMKKGLQPCAVCIHK